MTLDPNLISAAAMGLMALCAFTMDILSAPKHSRWMSLPLVIRWQVRVTGAAFMVRSVNLLSLSSEQGPVAGQVNWVGVVCMVCLAVTVLSLTLFALNNRLPARAWDRISYAMKAMRKRPGAVPVVMTAEEVVIMHQAMGQPAVLGDRPAQVAKEVARYGAAITRLSH